jgi:hypothetical protein
MTPTQLIILMCVYTALFFICAWPDRKRKREVNINAIYSKMDYSEALYAFLKLINFNQKKVGTLLRKFNPSLFN